VPITSTTRLLKSLFNFSFREQIKVYVCHIENLDRFFVQLQNSTINDLVQQMQDYYNVSCFRCCVHVPYVTIFLIVFFN